MDLCIITKRPSVYSSKLIYTWISNAIEWRMRAFVTSERCPAIAPCAHVHCASRLTPVVPRQPSFSHFVSANHNPYAFSSVERRSWACSIERDDHHRALASEFMISRTWQNSMHSKSVSPFFRCKNGNYRNDDGDDDNWKPLDIESIRVQLTLWQL